MYRYHIAILRKIRIRNSVFIDADPDPDPGFNQAMGLQITINTQLILKVQVIILLCGQNIIHTYIYYIYVIIKQFYRREGMKCRKSTRKFDIKKNPQVFPIHRLVGKHVH